MSRKIELNKLQGFVAIALIPILMFSMISLLSHPAYARFCAANIYSNPADADVYVDGELRGKTPFFLFVGEPFTANVTVVKEGYETQTEIINVPLDRVIDVRFTLVLKEEGPVISTETVTATITTTTSTTITSITTDTTTVTTTLTGNQVTVTSAVTTATTLTVTTTTKEPGTTITSEVTEQIGMPVELTYGAIGVTVIAVIASAIIATRKRR